MSYPRKRTFDLSAKKRALLETMLQKEGVESAPSQRIVRLEESGPAPLSFAQQRLWFLDQLAPDSAFYNLPVAQRLHGPLDLPALVSSLTALVARHESLRTSFPASAGQPCQQIAAPQPVALPLADLSALPPTDREEAAAALITAVARRPFDLAHGPLFRVLLVRLAHTEHVLLLTMHHSIADGWSIDVLFRDLSALYTTDTGTPATLAPLPIQYADYARWQRHWLAGARLQSQRAYWQQQLAGAPPLLELPSDRPRPPVQTFPGASVPLALPPALRVALLRLSHQTGATLFMTLLASFQVLLARYSGRTDILVGTPIAGRTRAELEGLIGFFVNTLVLRTDLAGDPTFRTLLGRVREVCLGAYAHQDLPFEMLVEELHPERNLSFNPLFQVLFALQDAPAENVNLAGLTTSSFPVDSGTAKVDLALMMTNTEQGLTGTLTYNTDLFDGTTIARMAGHFETLLEAVVASPEQPISQLPLLTAAEQRQLLRDWNATQAEYPTDACLHQLFEAQVARSPDAVALVFDRPTTEQGSGVRGQGSATAQGNPGAASPIPGPSHLTYRELDARANQLACRLRALGVGPDVPVGVCVERSLAMVIGLLGILKAGGAYVPLDPSYPPERLAFMIADIQAPVLLTSKGLGTRDWGPGDKETRRQGDKGTGRQATPSHAPSPTPQAPRPTPSMICLDADWPTIATAPPAAPASRVGPDNLAYVIYTSGSTGQPKGVCVPHRGIVNQLYARQVSCALGAHDRLLQHMSFAFDPSVWEIFAALVAGGCLVVARPDGQRDPAYLAALIAEQRITILQLVPSVLQALLEERGIADGSALRHVFCGGEALSSELRERFSERLAARLDHLYGPTEASIDATAWRYHGAGTASGSAPIGRPIANTQVYMLDRHLQPVPVGVPGELHIGGVGLARGYLNRPDLTAERFIPDPFADQQGARDLGLGTRDWDGHEQPLAPNPKPLGVRLYRTGDLARYLPDGSIMFLGRIDHQVKIRGYRIELGEVEAALAQHPAVREAIVLVREGRPGEKRLVAYLVASDELQVTRSDKQADSSLITRHSSLVAELRDFLKQKLPGHMVPAAFVTLAALPLLPSGKVDYQALPAPDTGGVEPDGAFVAPRTATEETVARIWADLLGQARVGVHDNFFDLGGHSLLGTRLILRMRDAFQVDLPLRHLFDTPTVASFAEAIDALRGDGSATTAGSAAMVSLEDEAVLDPTIVPEGVPAARRDEPATIFLTGATGFLGAFLLHDLLDQTGADIHCLMRAADQEQGARKLQRHLESLGLWNESFGPRIIAVIGDLALPLFGLSVEQFDTLAGAIDVIYHNGALVNFLYPYAALKATNVLGTQEVLRLACQRKVKPVHYVSTLSVFSALDCSETKVIREQDEPEQTTGLYSGYEQSKWVADKLVRSAGARGLPVSIYRPAAVTGHSRTGLVHPDDYTSRLIKGCIQLGMVQDHDRKMYLTPVDYVSKAIVYLSRQEEALGRAFHLINPRPMRWHAVTDWMSAFGYPLRRRPFDEWRAELSDVARHSQENALYPFVPLYLDERVAELERTDQHRLLEFDCGDSLAMLKKAAIDCPPVDDELLRTYFSYFIGSGFIAAPGTGRSIQEQFERVSGGPETSH